jgi:tripartite-type tricarboxylate transporter receptor subunit TctC
MRYPADLATILEVGGMRRREFISLLGAAIFPRIAGAAETYPTRPIRLIIPYPAGGGTDIVGRVIGEELRPVSASMKPLPAILCW